MSRAGTMWQVINLSIGYANAQSTLKNNDFTRLNMRFNTDVRFTKNLDCSLDVAYSNTTRNLRDDGMKDGEILAPGALGLIKAPILAAYIPDSEGRPLPLWPIMTVSICPIRCLSWRMAKPAIRTVWNIRSFR